MSHLSLKRREDAIDDVDLGTGIYQRYNQKYTSITELSLKAQKLIETTNDHTNSIDSMIIALEMHDKIIQQIGNSIIQAVSKIAGDDDNNDSSQP